mmetsp:Transcript_12424/g.52238  ORF Transcript_12424/g.52238 Transcript_12424/m.52238 type:complete len:315 (-) Transcript_12424:1540-2484(-)
MQGEARNIAGEGVERYTDMSVRVHAAEGHTHGPLDRIEELRRARSTVHLADATQRPRPSRRRPRSAEGAVPIGDGGVHQAADGSKKAQRAVLGSAVGVRLVNAKSARHGPDDSRQVGQQRRGPHPVPSLERCEHRRRQRGMLSDHAKALNERAGRLTRMDHSRHAHQRAAQAACLELKVWVPSRAGRHEGQVRRQHHARIAEAIVGRAHRLAEAVLCAINVHAVAHCALAARAPDLVAGRCAWAPPAAHFSPTHNARDLKQLVKARKQGVLFGQRDAAPDGLRHPCRRMVVRQPLHNLAQKAREREEARHVPRI